MLDRYFEACPIGEVHYVPQFPAYKDRAAWAQVSPADREALVAYAESWHEKPYPVITAGMYASFVRTGSRRDCENPYFDRRRKLCSAVLHVCLTGEKTMLPDVEDGVLLLCEETSWAISAHLGLTVEHPFPDEKNIVLDLFAAQTGMILSFTAQLMENVLHPDLHARIQREVERRVLTHFMESNGEWWMGFTRKDLNNWTPWIISNVLMTANVWHFGGTALVARACMMLDRWLDVVPEDGGCDEGAGYWNMAGGAFLDCLMALESMCAVDLWKDEKVRRMMAYPELVYLGNGWFANFADCDARPYLSGERLLYAGMKTDNPALARMGTELWGSPLKELNDTPHLSRVLMRIFATPAAVNTEKMEAAKAAHLIWENARAGHAEIMGLLAAQGMAFKNVWLPDLQVRILDSYDSCGGKDGPKLLHTTVAMKGGHNDESHNHNDVGSFLLAVNGEMQVVDAGNMVYTAKTFSDRRYELWNCCAAYHNVPIIGGCQQQHGRQYAARDVEKLPDGMALDMAAAYPAEAGVQACRRKLLLDGSRLSIMDDIKLDACKPVTWVFMLRDEPIIEQEDQCCHGRASSFFVEWRDTEPLTAAVEPIEITDGRMKNSYPGKIWRLTLTAAPAKTHSVHITMQP